MMNLSLPAGGNFGWGVCADNLRKAVAALPEFPGSDKVMIHATTGHTFAPVNPHISAEINIGYSFFEEDWLARRNIETAETLYDALAVGSSWCVEALKGRGNAIIQGVDPKLFQYKMTGMDPGYFTIFSGGKWEYRKGQDLVLNAVGEFMRHNPSVRLITNWQNPWPDSLNTMVRSEWITSPHSTKMEQHGFPLWMREMLRINEIPLDRVRDIGSVNHVDLPAVYHGTDIGIFPNRCEGGTNLVMMEYMASGRPVMATSETGHFDVLPDDTSIYFDLIAKTENYYGRGTNIITGTWYEACPSRILETLKKAFKYRNLLPSMGLRSSRHMKQFTWERTAQGFAALAKSLLIKKGVI